MRKVLCLLTLVLAAPLARADGSIAISGRAGASKPWGDAMGTWTKGNTTYTGGKMADGADWGFPLQADLQFRLMKSVSIGAYGRYAPVALASKRSDECKALNASCKANEVGFGALAEYRFSERLEGGPWVGVSAGYVMAKSEASGGGQKQTSTLTGYEGGVQVGTDFELGGLTLGPYLSLGAGQYGTLKFEGGGQSVTETIGQKKLHGWVGVGLRFTILL